MFSLTSRLKSRTLRGQNDSNVAEQRKGGQSTSQLSFSKKSQEKALNRTLWQCAPSKEAMLGVRSVKWAYMLLMFSYFYFGNSAILLNLRVKGRIMQRFIVYLKLTIL